MLLDLQYILLLYLTLDRYWSQTIWVWSRYSRICGGVTIRRISGTCDKRYCQTSQRRLQDFREWGILVINYLGLKPVLQNLWGRYHPKDFRTFTTARAKPEALTRFKKGGGCGGYCFYKFWVCSRYLILIAALTFVGFPAPAIVRHNGISQGRSQDFKHRGIWMGNDK